MGVLSTNQRCCWALTDGVLYLHFVEQPCCQEDNLSGLIFMYCSQASGNFGFLMVSVVVISYVSGLKVAYLRGYLQDVSGLIQSRSQYHVALYPCLLLPGTCVIA